MITLILSTACMNKSSKKSMKVEQKEKSPKPLTSVGEEIDGILGSMNDIEEILELSESELKAEKGGVENKKGETKDKGNEKDNDKNKETNPLAKDEELTNKWKEIDNKIEKIHEDWNNYEVESMKKGASVEKGKNFKKNLNLFTIAVENRNIPDIMDTGSKAIGSLAFFFDLYKDVIKGDLSRIKYAAYQAYLNAKNRNVPNANKLLGSTEEYITRLRQKLDKDKAKIKTLDKLSLAIADMKQSLNENSVKLWGLKRDIIIKNVKELEK